MMNINTTIKKLIFLTTAVFIGFIVFGINTNSINACGYGGCSGYSGYDNDRYYHPQPAPVATLGISCYSTPTSGTVGDTISWRSSPYGGTGNYYVTWSGNEGLSGYGTNITKVYNNSGSKYASVTVTSGNQTASANCGNNVDIRDIYVYNPTPIYPPYNPQPYNPPVYYPPVYSSPLYVYCSANTNSASINSYITWTANASGGSGLYTYNWSGTDSLYGSGSYISKYYNYAGIKSATVTVYSNGQSITQSCSNTVNIADQYNYNNNYGYNNTIITNTIKVACYADKTSAKPGTPVTWAVEATGSTGNFTYNWSGSENLTGNMFSVVKTYDNTGTKTATVSVTSSNGQSATQICGNSVAVNNGAAVIRYVAPVNTTPATTNTNNSNQNDNSAAALFSLSHVPWGLVGILVIVILMITVIYLIFNRNKV